MEKAEGSSPFIRSQESPGNGAFLRSLGRERVGDRHLQKLASAPFVPHRVLRRIALDARRSDGRGASSPSRRNGGGPSNAREQRADALGSARESHIPLVARRDHDRRLRDSDPRRQRICAALAAVARREHATASRIGAPRAPPRRATPTRRASTALQAWASRLIAAAGLETRDATAERPPPSALRNDQVMSEFRELGHRSDHLRGGRVDGLRVGRRLPEELRHLE